MDCHEFKTLIADYLIGKLDTEDLNSFALHMIECACCEEYILSLADILPDVCTDKGDTNNVL